MTRIEVNQVPYGDPAVHALVIGVGSYAHLPGGELEQFEEHDGMGQLTSPPQSAARIATWLKDHLAAPNLTLGTIDLLVSAAQLSPFKHFGEDIERASMSNIERAVLRWLALGDAHPDSLLLFFFSGHGIGSGAYSALLADDFGAPPKAAALRNAIDFNSLYIGMDQCKARSQCYFVDACRIASTTLLETHGYGTSILTPRLKPEHPLRRAPVYASTLPGARAYGLTGQPSFFTEAIISGLEGAGADDSDGNGWQVRTDALNPGIRRSLERLLEQADPNASQVIEANHMNDFTLHCLPGEPIVPVAVSCEPASANTGATLSVQAPGGANAQQSDSGGPRPWLLELEPGLYEFVANALPLRGQEQDYVRPPGRKIRIEVR